MNAWINDSFKVTRSSKPIKKKQTTKLNQINRKVKHIQTSLTMK